MIFWLVLFGGLFSHKQKPAKPVPAKEPMQMTVDKEWIAAVEDKIPMWYADEKHARYEMAEIATVQADIAMVHAATKPEDFYKDVAKTHEDWDKLLLLDEKLHQEIYL